MFAVLPKVSKIVLHNGSCKRYAHYSTSLISMPIGALQQDNVSVVQKERAAGAPAETLKLIRKDICKGYRGRRMTRCGAMQREKILSW